MAKVSMSTDLNASADDVWKMIGHFNALPDWHPAVEKSELTEAGQTRTLDLVGGGKIIEKLEKVDEGARTYTYSIVDSPLPVANYTATIKVSGEGSNSTIEWSSEFDPATGASPEDAMKAIQGVYQAGFDNLKKMFGG
ncbi:MAG: SRPBCC family protein [Hyphomicrobiaceae bacterium]|nr:SRPBCC family protein [Hyphomicrobiaceae bacterium]